MARPRAHLKNAPIVEAVIDFRVLRKEGTKAETFEGLAPSIGYAESFPIQTIEARFGLDDVPTSVKSAIGWQYRRTGAVAQFRIDGFTFSKLDPYTNWEDVFGEAVRLWRKYAEVANPAEIIRIAVRYINRLRVPAPFDVHEYLETAPVLPDPIPQAIREFLTRVTIEDHVRSASAVLVQALEPATEPGSISLLIDIDAFMENLALSAHDETLPEKFQQLRRLKNEIFYATITEKTVGIYE